MRGDRDHPVPMLKQATHVTPLLALCHPGDVNGTLRCPTTVPPSLLECQQTLSVGFGLLSPNIGRRRKPSQVPPRAVSPQIQPWRLNEAMPEK